MPPRRADEQVDALFGDEPPPPAPRPKRKREAREDRGTPAPVELGDEFWRGIHRANELRAEDDARLAAKGEDDA